MFGGHEIARTEKIAQEKFFFQSRGKNGFIREIKMVNGSIVSIARHERSKLGR